MGKVKEFKQEVELHLLELYFAIGIDKPENHDDILNFVADDVAETADPVNWHSGDVAIAFRRFLEDKRSSADDYFQIVKTGYNKELQREEVQIHGGDNANIFLVKTNNGFHISAYGENGLVNSFGVDEDDFISDEE